MYRERYQLYSVLAWWPWSVGTCVFEPTIALERLSDFFDEPRGIELSRGDLDKHRISFSRLSHCIRQTQSQELMYDIP